MTGNSKIPAAVLAAPHLDSSRKALAHFILDHVIHRLCIQHLGIVIVSHRLITQRQRCKFKAFKHTATFFIAPQLPADRVITALIAEHIVEQLQKLLLCAMYIRFQLTHLSDGYIPGTHILLLFGLPYPLVPVQPKTFEIDMLLGQTRQQFPYNVQIALILFQTQLLQRTKGSINLLSPRIHVQIQE